MSRNRSVTTNRLRAGLGIRLRLLVRKVRKAVSLLTLIRVINGAYRFDLGSVGGTKCL
jgi:hypothetical protein